MEMVETPIVSALDSCPQSTNSLFKWACLAVGFLIAIALFLNAYLLWQKSANPISSVSVAQPSTTQPSTTSSSTDPTAGWQTYTNITIGFSIKYPASWRKVGTETSTGVVGFGPANVGEDVQWAINIYDSSDSKTINKIVAEMGKQFGTDRNEQQKQIVVSGLPAIEAIITTPSIPTWVYRQILITNGNKIIAISNGAVEDSRFENFYKSFSVLLSNPPPGL